MTPSSQNICQNPTILIVRFHIIFQIYQLTFQGIPGKLGRNFAVWDISGVIRMYGFRGIDTDEPYFIFFSGHGYHNGIPIHYTGDRIRSGQISLDSSGKMMNAMATTRVRITIKLVFFLPLKNVLPFILD
jgi:hypothetical protein